MVPSFGSRTYKAFNGLGLFKVGDPGFGHYTYASIKSDATRGSRGA